MGPQPAAAPGLAGCVRRRLEQVSEAGYASGFERPELGGGTEIFREISKLMPHFDEQRELRGEE